MRILLDENFPLSLIHSLRQAGREAEHVILLGQRGVPDKVIRRRLETEEQLFPTQDTEFMDLTSRCLATVVVSRVTQGLPIRRRVEIWSSAIQEFFARRPKEKLFEIYDDGKLVPSSVIDRE